MSIHYRGLALASLLFSTTLGARDLEIYWIDTDGGAATLIVSPSGESLLIDTGNRRPDDHEAKRIFDAAKLAGLQKIDTVLTSHFHGDHYGGLAALAKLIPIGTYMDHGDSVELDRPLVAELFGQYKQLAGKARRIVRTGDRIPLKGVDVQVVISGGKAIAKPLKGAGSVNALCRDFKEHTPDVDPDNDQSVGIVLTYEKFDFLDLSDLTWNSEPKLVCPNNLIGKIDLFQVTHHAMDRSNSPQMLMAIDPLVAVMSNGARKGGAGVAGTFEILRKGPSLQDIWQNHTALAAPAEINTDPRMIANLDPTDPADGRLISARVEKGGKFTITNHRTQFSKIYQAK